MKFFTLLASISILLVGAYYAYPHYALNYSSLLIVNSDSKGKLPRMFRMTPFDASASSQFSEDGLKNLIQTIPSKHITIVDLREESHGFLNGDAISWYGQKNWLNKEKTKDELMLDENEKLTQLNQRFAVLVFKEKSKPVLYFIKEALSEKDVANQSGAAYFRLPVRDHVRPSDEAVDDFIRLFRNLQENEWLHFHCSAGKGRSTTFLVIYDMMLHSAKSSLQNIIDRQFFYGGVNLFVENESDGWKYSYVVERMEFLKKFYEYCRENPDFQILWSEWVRSKDPSVVKKTTEITDGR